ncbi:heavy metal-responsive transcriptional regulator [Almyronema epifaneia]|uniref:Heavy metal-responsive transcriptional regulator n=1 Tax=Almyronema epifaneia S1 TaxID=2991925 RepID=A0ABW6IEA2_9CYAN
MLAQESQFLKIGEVHQQSQVPIKTIRYYEELGLIQSARRTRGGFRLFWPEVLTRLAFIKQAQSLGLSLQEIGEILALHDQGQIPCQTVRQKFQQKIVAINDRIEQLTQLKNQLTHLLDQATPTTLTDEQICPIIESH